MTQPANSVPAAAPAQAPAGEALPDWKSVRESIVKDIQSDETPGEDTQETPVGEPEKGEKPAVEAAPKDKEQKQKGRGLSEEELAALPADMRALYDRLGKSMPAEWTAFFSQKAGLKAKRVKIEGQAKTLEAERASFAKEREQYGKDLEEWKADRALLESDPKAFWNKEAKRRGKDFLSEYERWAKDWMLQQDPAMAEVRKLQKAQEDRERADKEAKEKFEAEQKQSRNRDVEQSDRKAIADELRSRGGIFNALSTHESLADIVYSNLWVHHQKTGKLKPLDKAIEELETGIRTDLKRVRDWEAEEERKRAGAEQPDTERVNGGASRAKPGRDVATSPSPTTLTNRLGTQRSDRHSELPSWGDVKASLGIKR